MRVEEIDACNKQHIVDFLQIGRTYLEELDDTPSEVNERFLNSLVRRLQSEPDRWLVMAFDDQPCGFCYSMVDKQDRPGWGFIAEFYVDAMHRRRGVGSQLYDRAEILLARVGVRHLWLTSNDVARPFWLAKGLQSTGEVESNGHEVMIKMLCCSGAGKCTEPRNTM